MARTAIPLTALNRTGVAPPSQTNADSTNKHTLDNAKGRTFVEIVSSDAGSQHVDFELAVSSDVLDGGTVPPHTVTLAAGVTRMVGPFPRNLYGTSINVDPSVSTTLKFRAYSI